MKSLALLLPALALVALLIVALCQLQERSSWAYETSLGGVADDRHRAALEYHGIKGAYMDKGEWVFDRGGKRCKLFTKAFKAEWEAR